MEKKKYTLSEDEVCRIREDIDRTAQNVVKYMIGEKITLASAESCTGGMIASAVTSIAGASNVFGCGIVSYSVECKENVLGVDRSVIDSFGVVSAETALAMAEAVKKLSGSDIAVAVTGLAGPKSDSDVLPVGTVYAAVVYKDIRHAENLKLYELGELTREENRLMTVKRALELTYSALTDGLR